MRSENSTMMGWSRRTIATAAAWLLCLALVTVLLLEVPTHSKADTQELTGWAWSDTIGWISFNCINTSSCGTSNYVVSTDESGALSGYAWSDSVGWIKFGGLGGFPSGGGTSPQDAQLVGNALIGWARACAGTVNGNCTGGDRTDGWDGWISLSGTSPNYGPTLTGDDFEGFAWGSDVVGWIDFQYAHTDFAPCTPATEYLCTGAGGQTITASSTSAQCVHTLTDGETCNVTTNFCSPGASTCSPVQPSFPPDGHLDLIPTLVPKGSTTVVHWEVENVTNCTVMGSNDDSWSAISSADATCTHDPSTGGCISMQIQGATTYTLLCTPYEDAIFTPETKTVNIVPVFEEL